MDVSLDWDKKRTRKKFIKIIKETPKKRIIIIKKRKEENGKQKKIIMPKYPVKILSIAALTLRRVCILFILASFICELCIFPSVSILQESNSFFNGKFCVGASDVDSPTLSTSTTKAFEEAKLQMELLELQRLLALQEAQIRSLQERIPPFSTDKKETIEIEKLPRKKKQRSIASLDEDGGVYHNPGKEFSSYSASERHIHGETFISRNNFQDLPGRMQVIGKVELSINSSFHIHDIDVLNVSPVKNSAILSYDGHTDPEIGKSRDQKRRTNSQSGNQKKKQRNNDIEFNFILAFVSTNVSSDEAILGQSNNIKNKNKQSASGTNIESNFDQKYIFMFFTIYGDLFYQVDLSELSPSFETTTTNMGHYKDPYDDSFAMGLQNNIRSEGALITANAATTQNSQVFSKNIEDSPEGINADYRKRFDLTPVVDDIREPFIILTDYYSGKMFIYDLMLWRYGELVTYQTHTKAKIKDEATEFYKNYKARIEMEESTVQNIKNSIDRPLNQGEQTNLIENDIFNQQFFPSVKRFIASMFVGRFSEDLKEEKQNIMKAYFERLEKVYSVPPQYYLSVDGKIDEYNDGYAINLVEKRTISFNAFVNNKSTNVKTTTVSRTSQYGRVIIVANDNDHGQIQIIQEATGGILKSFSIGRRIISISASAGPLVAILVEENETLGNTDSMSDLGQQENAKLTKIFFLNLLQLEIKEQYLQNSDLLDWFIACEFDHLDPTIIYVPTSSKETVQRYELKHFFRSHKKMKKRESEKKSSKISNENELKAFENIPLSKAHSNVVKATGDKTETNENCDEYTNTINTKAMKGNLLISLKNQFLFVNSFLQTEILPINDYIDGCVLRFLGKSSRSKKAPSTTHYGVLVENTVSEERKSGILSKLFKRKDEQKKLKKTILYIIEMELPQMKKNKNRTTPESVSMIQVQIIVGICIGLGLFCYHSLASPNSLKNIKVKKSRRSYSNHPLNIPKNKNIGDKIKPTLISRFSVDHSRSNKGDKCRTGFSFLETISTLFSIPMNKKKPKGYYEDLSDCDSDVDYDRFDDSSDSEDSNSVESEEDITGLGFNVNTHHADNMEREANVDLNLNGDYMSSSLFKRRKPANQNLRIKLPPVRL